MQNKSLGFVALGLVLIGLYFVSAPQQEPTFSAIKLANPTVSGTKSVGISFKSAKQASAILSQFAVTCPPPEATSTTESSSTCIDPVVTYKGEPVRVYAVFPQGISKELADALGSFPFSGKLEYRDIEEAKIDSRIIKLMEEQGNSTYDVIYEK